MGNEAGRGNPAMQDAFANRGLCVRSIYMPMRGLSLSLPGRARFSAGAVDALFSGPPHARSVSATRRFASVAILVLAAAFPGPVEAQPGIFSAVDSLLQHEVDQQHVAGAVVQIARRGEILHRGAYGYAQRYAYGMEPLEPPDAVTPEHLFDLASLTKVFATTFGIMMLVDRGVIDLDAPLRQYLPEFTGGGKDYVTVRHLLTHTSGLTEWTPLYYHAGSKAETYESIVDLPLRYEVGSGRHYSDLGFMLLGYLVERMTRQALDDFLRENLYGPLDLHNTLFTPVAHGVDTARIAATSHGNPFEYRMVHDGEFGYRVDVDPDAWNEWRDYTLRGEVNDGNAYYAHDGVAGHAGLFSTVDDLQVLLDLVLAGGHIDGDTLISGRVIDEFLIADSVSGNGLGWAMDPSVIQARGAPEGTFGHTGFTGTSVVAVPEHDLTIILLTNRQNVGPDVSGRYFDVNPVRQQIVTYVLKYLER